MEKKQFYVFLSSTFSDMHGERDYLREHAFRRLDMQLRGFGYSLYVMDLRGSSEEDDSISYDERVLQMCLRRVDDCKPRMLGLLGDRYGWIFYGNREDYTDQDAFLRAEKVAFDIADRHDLSQKLMQGISVTHLEILYGLNNVDLSRCFFYFRNLSEYEKIPENERRLYAPDIPEKQDELKDNIRRIFGNSVEEHVRNYQAEYKPGGSLIGLEALDEMIYHDLWNSFKKDIEQEEKIYSFDLHKRYLEEKTRVSVLLPSFVQVKKYISEDKNLIITGNAGSGKSVLMAQLYTAISPKTPSVVFCAGLNAVSRKETELLKILSEQIVFLLGKGEFDNFSFPKTIEEQRNLFWDLITQFSESKKKLILFIDSIDSLETQSQSANFLSFLPEYLPAGVHIVMTSKPDTIRYRGQIPIEQIHLPSLSLDDAVVLVNSIAGLFSKGLEKTVVDAVSKRIADSGGLPLYARIITEYLCQMTGKDYRTFSGNDAHIQWMLSEIGSMPLSVSEAYAYIVDRAKNAYGEEVTGLILDLMAISRNGIPADLVQAVIGKEIENVSKLTTLEIRDYFFGHLRQDLNLSWWAFEHQQFREFCLAQISTKKQIALHRLVLEILDEFPSEDDYKKREYLYHSLNADLHENAIRFVATMPAHSEEYHAIFNDFLEYNDQQKSVFLAETMQTAKKQHNTESIHFFLRMLPYLSGQSNAPTVSFAYLKKIITCAVQCGEEFSLATDQKTRFIYPMSVFLKGRQAMAEKALDEAVGAFNQCVQIIEANISRKLSPYEIELYMEVQLNLGAVSEDKGQIHTAKKHYEAGLEIIEEMDKYFPGKYISDQIRIEIFFARTARDTAIQAKEDAVRNQAYTESKEHYEKVLSLCDAAISAGNNSVGKSKIVALEEYGMLSGGKEKSIGATGANKQIDEAFRLAKATYTARPGDISAILTYVSACKTAAEQLRDKTLAKEAFEILYQAMETIPDRPKITEKMAELTLSIAELEVEDGNPAVALTYFVRILDSLATFYKQTGQFALYGQILLKSCELAQQAGDVDKEAVLREEALIAFENETAKQTDDFQNITIYQLTVMWDTFLFYKDEKYDNSRAYSCLINLKNKLFEIVSKRVARDPYLRMQVGYKLHSVAIVFYQAKERNEAYMLWDKASDVLDELIDFFPGEEKFTEFRERVLNEIVTILNNMADPKEKEWRKRLDMI